MVKIVGAPGYEDFEAVVIDHARTVDGRTVVVVEDGEGEWHVFEEKYVKGTGSA